MLNAFEAVVQPNGYLGFLEPKPPIFNVPTKVYVLVQNPITAPSVKRDEALSGLQLSESSLAADWLRPEEDAAWAHLQ
jgi:hypothetical protein